MTERATESERVPGEEAEAASGVTTAPGLELLGVRKVFRTDVFKGKQVAIDDLTLRFARGACTGLLGHNGAGKTTTIRMILGLVRPDRGEIRLDGRPLKTGDKRWIGYMPEVSKLPAALTPEEILHHQLRLFAPAGLRTTAERRAAVEAKLAEVGLSGHRQKRIGKLSKGMGRRVAWAQATIHAPRLLILDEPSSGLDPLGRRQMLGWIEAEKRRGTTIVLCTHELAQISTLCDDLHVLRRGRLVLTSGRSVPAAAHGETDGAAPSDSTGRLAWRQRYNIHVSGVDEAGLGRLRDAERLPSWAALDQERFLAVLGFDDYGPAARWLASLLARGFVVVRFGDATYLGEDELLPFFEEAP